MLNKKYINEMSIVGIAKENYTWLPKNAPHLKTILSQKTVHKRIGTLQIPEYECQQNYHNSHTKFKFGMIIVGVLCDPHTLEFAVYNLTKAKNSKSLKTCLERSYQILKISKTTTFLSVGLTNCLP